MLLMTCTAAQMQPGVAVGETLFVDPTKSVKN